MIRQTMPVRRGWNALVPATRPERRLLVLAGSTVLLGVVLGIVASQAAARTGTVADRARRMASRGHLAAAERLYVDALQGQDPVDLDLLMELLALQVPPRPAGERRPDQPWIPEPRKVTDADVEAIVTRASRVPETAALVRLSRAAQAGDVPEEIAAPVRELADRDPPAPWSNRLLARLALREGEESEAARRLDREGIHHPAHAEDVDDALRMWLEVEAWDEVRTRLADPRYDGLVSPRVRFQMALADRDAGQMARWFVPSLYGEVTWTMVIPTVVSALALVAFGLHLGISRQAPRRRVPLYVGAFVCGALSTWPTVALIYVEEDLLGFRMDGSPGMDLAYCVFGIALREEVCKLVLALPLLAVLGRQALRLEVMAAGAMVGLGFAAEENLNYFASPSLTEAMGRFLTANVAHMAMTGILVLGLHDLRRGRGKPEDFSTALALVVGLHGAYDFLIMSPQFADVSFLSMTIFVLLLRRLLGEVAPLRHGVTGVPLLHVFIVCLAAVTAAGYVFASTLVGPVAAAFDMALGLLGLAVIIYMFALEMPS